jgi:hypothetical protein
MTTMRPQTLPTLFLVLLLAGALAACESADRSSANCDELGRCDTPDDTANRVCAETCCAEAGLEGDELDSCVAFPSGEAQSCFTACREEKAIEHCELRRNDALRSSERAFSNDAIRWACADVEGVNTNNRDDRGQEYCEYYAVIQPPPELGSEDVPEPLVLGRKLSNSTETPINPELSGGQLAALSSEPDAVVGQCIFHSWHQDIFIPYPACEGDSCPEVTLADGAVAPSWMPESLSFGVPLTEEFMRMKITINSNNAASDLAEKCMAPAAGGRADDAEDPLHDDYMRGCMRAFSLFTTEWRRSDPTICAAAMRLSECGCGLDTTGDGVADVLLDPNDSSSRWAVATALVPPQPQNGEITLRGFPLGTWSGQSALPDNCRYLDTGDDSQTAVACDLTALDILNNPSDPKEACRETYGRDVVVHIPIPTEAVVCTPPGGAYDSSCGELTPWTAP